MKIIVTIAALLAISACSPEMREHLTVACEDGRPVAKVAADAVVEGERRDLLRDLADAACGTDQVADDAAP